MKRLRPVQDQYACVCVCVCVCVCACAAGTRMCLYTATHRGAGIMVAFTSGSRL